MTNNYVKNLLSDNEKILLITRQHAFVLLKDILAEIFFIILISAGTIAISVITSVTPFLSMLIWIIGSVILLIPIIGMIHDILVWVNKQFIVSNRRVIQVAGIINKQVTDSSLEKVNDVKMVQSFWGKIFNYGDIEILTASEMGANLFKMIGDPVHVKTTMLNAKEGMGDEDIQVKQSKAQVVQAAVAIPDMLTELDALKQKGIISEAEFEEKKKELLSRY